MNHVAHNSILQKPSPHSGMHWLRFPIRACIDSHPCIRAYMDSGGKQVRLFLLEFDFTSLRHEMTSWRQNFNWSGKCWSRPLIWGTTLYSSFDLKIWPWGTSFFTLPLTMKVISDRPSELISWVADYMLLSHHVWSWSNQNYSKNQVLSVLWLGPILTLTFDFDPYNSDTLIC
jgi:hypothetical protein